MLVVGAPLLNVKITACTIEEHYDSILYLTIQREKNVALYLHVQRNTMCPDICFSCILNYK